MDAKYRNFLRRLQFGIPNFLENLRGTPQERRILGALTLAFSILIGGIAYEKTYRTSIETWLKENHPTPKFIRTLLEANGYREVLTGPERHRGLRWLPASWDHPGEIWCSDDFNWVVYFFDPDQHDLPNPLLYTREKKAARTWRPLGQGWPGTQKLTNALIQSPPPTSVRAKPKKKKRRVFLDPRQIHY